MDISSRVVHDLATQGRVFNRVGCSTGPRFKDRWGVTKSPYPVVRRKMREHACCSGIVTIRSLEAEEGISLSLYHPQKSQFHRVENSPSMTGWHDRSRGNLCSRFRTSPAEPMDLCSGSDVLFLIIFQEDGQNTSLRKISVGVL